MAYHLQPKKGDQVQPTEILASRHAMYVEAGITVDHDEIPDGMHVPIGTVVGELASGKFAPMVRTATVSVSGGNEVEVEDDDMISLFQVGDTINVGDDEAVIDSIDADENEMTLVTPEATVASVDAAAITVDDATGFEEGDTVHFNDQTATIDDVTGDVITVDTAFDPQVTDGDTITNPPLNSVSAGTVVEKATPEEALYVVLHSFDNTEYDTIVGALEHGRLYEDRIPNLDSKTKSELGDRFGWA